MSRIGLILLNSVYSWIISATIMVASVYSVYSIWDNFQVYQAAEDVQEQIRELKPEVSDDPEKGGPNFEELRKVNKDVVGWITVDGTNIDYPVLQGETNLTYMDQDVYGNFSMAGSIFLDTRNHPDFSDNYSLIYGHNMDEHLMFGDLALFKNKEFFKDNQTATLMIPGESRDLSVVAVLQIPAGTDEIFNPHKWRYSLAGLGEYLKQSSIWYRTYWIDRLMETPDELEIVSLVTCSSGSTNDRTVLVLTREKPKKPEDPEEPEDPDGPDKPDEPDDPEGPGGGEANNSGDPRNPRLWFFLMIGNFLFIVAYELIEQFVIKRKERI